MKAIVFAAGLGTRLYPLTATMPKALVDVGGKPMLQHVIEKLKDYGVSSIVVNVHHFPDMIIDFLKKNNNFDVDIQVSDERDLLLDTGGGTLKASAILDGNEPIILHNADILTDFNLGGMIACHISSGADVTLLVSDRDSSRYLLFDQHLTMRGWTNVKTGEVKPSDIQSDLLSRYAFGGVHIISPCVLRYLSEYGTYSPVFSIVPFYIDYCNQLNIRGFLPSESYCWFDIGKPATLEKARQSYFEK